MVFPYYPRPEDDTQEPDEEQQSTDMPSWVPSYIYAYVGQKPTPPAQSPMPTTPDPAIEEYNERQEERIGYKPEKNDSVAQPSSSGGGAGKTTAPKRPSYLDDVEAYGQRAEQRAAAQLAELADIAEDEQLQSDSQPATVEPDWYGNMPLTPGQAMHVDHLLHVETDHLAREVLITLKREGVPPNSHWRDFLEQYALSGWYAASDAIAWATLAAIAESDWDEWLGHADAPGVEGVAQDKGDDLIEGLVIIDAGSGNVVLSKTGVRGPGGQQYVGLLDTEVAALQGLELIFVHNHPNGSDASEEDLDSAFRAGAELLIVITPQGQEFVYIRGRYGMVKVRDEKASYVVGPENPEETEVLHDRSEEQAAAFEDDSPELIFLQEERECPEGPPDGSDKWVSDGQGNCIYKGNQGVSRVILPVDLAWEYHEEATQAMENSHVQTLFLTPARNLNSVYLTNMTDNALASLALSQTYVEENWFRDYLYPHPYYNRGDDPAHASRSSIFPTQRKNINDKRYISSLLGFYAFRGFGWISDAINRVVHSREGGDSLSGVGFGLANQPLFQAWDAVDWYWNYSQNNTDVTDPLKLNTHVYRNQEHNVIQVGDRFIYPRTHRTPNSELITEISDGGLNPLDPFFGGGIDSTELNVLRFVYAGARQREGLDYTGGIRDYEALDNARDGVRGRPYQDVSALSLMAYVFTGAITTPEFIKSSERNKAILTVERLRQGHPDNFRIVTNRGLGLDNLVTAYDVADSPDALSELSVGQEGYDYLPYNEEEATKLVAALARDATVEGQSSLAYKMLVHTEGSSYLHAQLLLDAYIFYHGENALDEVLQEITTQ